ncbi:MAG: SH3 domain-containing protein [Bdellovibrionales bacterium]|nr:SH3 domain-containing protein [Bdellovibrionales bacterium]
MSKNFLLLLQAFVVLLFFSLMVFEANAVCISSSYANLRAAPSTKSAKTWKVVKYMPFQQLKSSRGWTQVKDVDGDTHWVSDSLITSKVKCAVVKAKRANLRTAPNGAKHPKFSTAEKYVTFRYLGTKGGWAKVQDEQGTSYWISRSLIWVQ